MNTLPERTERRCLNCDAITYGRYCQVCGQANVQHKMSFFGMLKHFVFDLLHFDGKFFKTIKRLLIKPGDVPLQYINGKRMAFLEPFKMYLFTSTLLFLSIAYLPKNSEITSTKSNNNKRSISISVGNGEDTLPIPSNYADYRQFEAALKQNKNLSVNWFSRLIYKKVYEFAKNTPDSNINYDDLLRKEFFQKLPKVLFFILPFFTWVLQLLYIRKKKYVFSEHGIFTLYFFVFMFMVIILCNSIFTILHTTANTQNFGDFNLFAFLLILLHLLLALKKFYGQGWVKTILKYFVFLIFGGILIAFIFLILLIIGFIFF